MKDTKGMVGFALAVLAVLLIGAVSLNYGDPRDMRELYISITADTSGDSWTTLDEAYSVTGGGVKDAAWINGKVYRVNVFSDATSTPTNLWDLTIVDEDTVDVLAGAFANIDSSTTESEYFDPPVPISGVLRVNGDNMGSKGTAYIRFLFAP